MNNIRSSLLPNGLKDLLSPEAEREAHIISLLMAEFSQFGYDRVKPPLVEFEETLLGDGPGQALAHKTFRIMDPVSGRMMGARADITAQIARIATSRLSDDPRPLRLSYAGDILKVTGSQLRPERQFCQVGCEMIGVETAQDDAELCLISLLALNKIGVVDLSIDLTIPTLIEEIYDAYDCDDALKEELNKLLQKRDRDGILAMKHDVCDALIALLDLSGRAQKVLPKLDEVALPKTSSKHIDHLKQVYAHLTSAIEIYELNDVDITVDFIERRGFEYKNGMSFTLFSKSARGELGRGGRYKMCEDTDQNAAGLTLYMDSILPVAGCTVEAKEQNISRDASWSDIKKLQQDGYKVSRK